MAAHKASSCDALKSCVRGRGARAAHGAKEPAVSGHLSGRRCGALALKVLLEAWAWRDFRLKIQQISFITFATPGGRSTVLWCVLLVDMYCECTHIGVWSTVLWYVLYAYCVMYSIVYSVLQHAPCTLLEMACTRMGQ